MSYAINRKVKKRWIVVGGLNRFMVCRRIDLDKKIARDKFVS